MKLYDVMVYDNRKFTNVVYKGSLIKRDAKKLSKQLNEKGYKSHVLPTKSNRDEADFIVPTDSHDEPDE